MDRPKVPVVRLSELKAGQSGDFFVLLAHRHRGATREGKPYYLCKFRDAKRTASAMIWFDGGRFEECQTKWRAGDFYKIRGVYQESERYGPQIDIQQIRPVQDADREAGFDPNLLVDRSRQDSPAMLAELKALATNHIADEPLRRLVLAILERHAEALQLLPATRDKFYPFVGGLLEHMLSVTQLCLELTQTYAAHYAELRPPLNRDLVVAGAILHDIGRVQELGDGREHTQVTVAGRLLGHLVLGRDLVRDTARELGDVNPETVQLLEHLLLTHAGPQEGDSPRVAMVPEVLIVRHADELDAQMEMFVRCLMRDQEDGPFTVRDPALGKRLFKGRSL